MKPSIRNYNVKIIPNYCIKNAERFLSILIQFVNNIVNDVDQDNFMLARTLDILEFRCVYPTVQMATGEINPLVQ